MIAEKNNKETANLFVLENDKLKSIQKEIQEIKSLILENKIDIVKNYIKCLDLETKKYFAENDLFIDYLLENSHTEIKKILISKKYNINNIIDKSSLNSELLSCMLDHISYHDIDKIIEKYQISYKNFSEECSIKLLEQGKTFQLEYFVTKENLLLKYLEKNIITTSTVKYFYENAKYISVQIFLIKNYKVELNEGEYLRLKEIEPNIVEYCLKNKTNFSNILKYESNDLDKLKLLCEYELSDSSRKELLNKILKFGTIEAIKFLIDSGNIKLVLEGIKNYLIKEEVLIQINEVTTNIDILDELKKCKIKSLQDKVFILSNKETKVFNL